MSADGRLSRRPPSRVWLFGAVAVVLLATLPPQPSWPGSHRQFFSSLFPDSTGGLLDVAQNVVLYAPLGFVLAGRGVTGRRVWWMAALLSALTEILQLVIPGRSPALRDVIVNTLGAIAGSMLWSTRTGRHIAAAVARFEAWGARASTPDARLASRLIVLWAVTVTTVLAGTALLLTPAPPPHEYWVASPYLDAGEVPLYIGSDGSSEGHFAGLIDDVRIFSSARTVEQILVDMRDPVAATAMQSGDLVAAYGFDADGRVARDDSGRGRNGMVGGATWVPGGRAGGALSFDGVSSEVIVPFHPSLDLRAAMTLEGWVRPGPGARQEPTLISRGRSLYYLAASAAGQPLHAAGGGRFGGVPRYATLLRPLDRDQWTHLAATYDGQALRLYRNGVLEATQIHWSPHRPEHAAINGAPLSAGHVPASAEFREQLRGDVAIDVEVRCGNTSARSAPVFLMEGYQDSEVFALDAAGTELRIRSWTWARRLNLASPPSRVKDAFTACAPGTRTTMGVSGRLQNPAATRDGQPAATLSPGLGAAWAFVWHAELAPIWAQVALTCAWLVALAVPAGYWARFSVPWIGSVGVVSAACVLVPRTMHARSLSPLESAAILAGMALGMACGRIRLSGQRS